MKKIILMLLVLMAAMPLANAASVTPSSYSLWPYGDTIEELQASGDYYLEPQESGEYLVSLKPVDSLVSMRSMSVMSVETVDPVLFDPWKSGNAAYECEKAGASCGFSYKFDNWASPSGPYNVDGGNTITITGSTSKTFNWASDYPVCAVIVKASTKANVYYYDGAYRDTGLFAPENKDISHVTFCYGNGGEIPEFPTVALPIAAILGLAFVFMRRKN